MLQRRTRIVTPKRRRYHVHFKLGEKSYALPADQLFGVSEAHQLTLIPSEHPWNLGVVLFRGQALGLVDLQRLIDKTEAPVPALPLSCIFCKTSRGVVGFPVDQIHGLESIFDDESLSEDAQPLSLELLENLP